MAAQKLRWLTYLLTDLGEAPRSPPVLYANTADVFTKALQPYDHQPCFALLDWSCDLLFSPTLPMGSESGCPPSVRGQCALGTDVLEDKQED
ncbi:unnamed protein product [Closterium sp. NIES-53]